MNVEVMYSIDFYKLKRQSIAIPSFMILRFAVQSGRQLPERPV